MNEFISTNMASMHPSTKASDIQNVFMAREGFVHCGYDQGFVGEVDDRLVCLICTKVLREPHRTVCCGQNFCEYCLKQSKKGCPHCHAEGERFSHVINNDLKSEINKLRIKCSNHNKGCEWKGELVSLMTHLLSVKGCDFVRVCCPNRCRSKEKGVKAVLRKDLTKHLQSCDLRQFKCIHCGHRDTYTAIVGGRHYDMYYCGPRRFTRAVHYDVCPEFPLTCPNKCGINDIKRKDMSNHRSECPQEPVCCPFAEAGCWDRPQRCQLNGHMTSNQQQHLLLVMTAYKRTEKSIAETNRKLFETEKTLSETKKELCKTRGALSTAFQLLMQAKGADKESVEFIIASSNRLKCTSDLVRIVMPRFSDYCLSGNVWHSPPFYYKEGYKMCLAISAKKKYGTCKYISISLLLLKGELDDHLKWPMQSPSLSLRDSMNPSLMTIPRWHSQFEHDRVTDVTDYKELEQHENYQIFDKHLVNDSLIINVEFHGTVSSCTLYIGVVMHM